MNTPLLEAQTTALLQRLANEQAVRTQRLRDAAAAQARDIVRRARSEARARVQDEATGIRRQQHAALVQRQAAIETRCRRARQATVRRLLDDAWQQLPVALAARWSDRDARHAWCVAACRQALRHILHAEHLVVAFDPRWRDGLSEVVERALSGQGHGTLEVVAIDGLGPGLTVRGGKACIDATVPGLLAARERIAAELLAGIEQALDARDGAPA
jgi:hypothetical protein